MFTFCFTAILTVIYYYNQAYLDMHNACPYNGLTVDRIGLKPAFYRKILSPYLRFTFSLSVYLQFGLKSKLVYLHLWLSLPSTQAIRFAQNPGMPE